MKRFIATLALLLALVTPAFAADVPALPFKTFNEAARLVVSTQPACDGSVMRLDMGPEWDGMIGENRVIFIHYTDGAPDYAYFVEGKSAEITVIDALTIPDAIARHGASPCSYLVPSKPNA